MEEISVLSFIEICDVVCPSRVRSFTETCGVVCPFRSPVFYGDLWCDYRALHDAGVRGLKKRKGG